MIDVTKKLIDYDGNPLKFKEKVDSEARDMTAKDVFVPALIQPSQQRVGWEESIKRDELAKKIYHATAAIELSSEEKVMIKNNVGSLGLSHTAIAQSVKILEGKDG